MTRAKKPEDRSRDFKLQAVNRMLGGANVSALARALGVRRKLLYEWRDAFRAGGPEALRGRGRPRKGTAGAAPAALASDGGGAPPADGEAALAAALRRVAELERKVGQQQLDLDFFKQALRQVEALRRPSERPGAAASTPSSRR